MSTPVAHPASAHGTVRVVARPAFRNRDRNPYNWLLYTHLRQHGVEARDLVGAHDLRADDAILHLHWPEARLAVGPALTALKQMLAQHRAIRRARRLGIKVVWTVHNLQAHERVHPWLERLFWRLFIPQLDGFISPSEAGRTAALARYPRLARIPGFVIPIGHFRGVYPNTTGRAEARARLNVPASATVIGYVGLIRSYKNVPRLLNAFRELAEPDAVLVAAGQVEWPETEAAIRAAAGEDPRIRLDLGFVPDDQLQLYLNAADLVVFPFSEVLNSASALLALSFDRPVLVPDVGAMAELREVTGADWVRIYAGELSATDLAEALRWIRERNPRRAAPLDDLGWSRVAERTAAAYRAIRREPSARGSGGALVAGERPNR